MHASTSTCWTTCGRTLGLNSSLGPRQNLDDLSLPELIQRFREAPSDAEDAALSLGELTIRIQGYGEPGLSFLLDERAAIEQDEARLRAVLLGLTHERRDDATVRSLLLGYLDDARPLIVMDVIDGLRYELVYEAREQVIALAQHPSPYVRGVAVHYMAGLFPDEATELLLIALSDEHFIVRESAIDAIDDEGLVELLPAVRPLLDDAHPHVRGAAQWALMDYDERMRYNSVREDSTTELEADQDSSG